MNIEVKDHFGVKVQKYLPSFHRQGDG